jgi:hypothetical protein
MHGWTSFLSFQQQEGTNLNPKEFNKPCLLSFSNGAKQLRVEDLCRKLTTPQNNNY